MMDDAMDVDGSSDTSSKTSHIETQPQFPDVINSQMTSLSNLLGWQSRIEQAGDDVSKWQGLLRRVFENLLSCLHDAELGSNLITFEAAQQRVVQLKGDDLERLKVMVRQTVEVGKWENLTAYLAIPVQLEPNLALSNSRRLHHYNLLKEAYNVPYTGDAAQEFVKYLIKCESDVRQDVEFYYAKAVPVLQSSGTGKSRMLTEAGKLVFTLPICLRHPDAPGYPPSDKKVFDYFNDLTLATDLSFTAHSAVVRFLAACHETMLAWLEAGVSAGHNGPKLLEYWQELMEQNHEERGRFFSEVVETAASITVGVPYHPSPKSRKDNTTDIDIEAFAKNIYNERAMGATEKLMEFLNNSQGRKVLCVTYFDEADALGVSFWILLRLLSNQPEAISMWYVFMATKSKVDIFSPPIQQMLSLRLKGELKHLINAYFALGFDQNVISRNGQPVCVKIDVLRSIEHLCRYGRPLWLALFQDGFDLPDLARLKLTNAGPFDARNPDHVLAILSQRLCVEPVLASSEAMALANRSVAHHMRLLTGISTDHRVFYTHTPSEPLLVLGAIKILYSVVDGCWSQVLSTFSKKLCESGLIEKGLIGELAARTLLLIARDFSAPRSDSRPDLLALVPLLNFLDQLFGSKTWCGEHRSRFESAFENHFVNFTHWMITKDSLPEMPNHQILPNLSARGAAQQILPNLWARGAALQCCFTQESIDLLIPTYTGPVSDTSVFDPELLSGVVVQVKNKMSGDLPSGKAIGPRGIPRDPYDPLPYLALFLELGTETPYRGGNKVQIGVPEPSNTTFQTLKDDFSTALENVQKHKQWMVGKGKKVIARARPQTTALRAAFQSAQERLGGHKRYSIFVRGTSPEVYGILNTANISSEFKMLVDVTVPSAADQNSNIRQQMRPLERMAGNSGHMEWMWEYTAEEPEDAEGEM